MIFPIDNLPSSHIVLYLTFIKLQLDRIVGKPPIHVQGPKKPSLSQQDLASR